VSEHDDERPPPTVIVLMAEHGGVYLWNRSPVRPRYGDDYVIDPVELGVSAVLIARMRAWNDEFEATALTGYEFPSQAAEEDWAGRGRELAYELQNELPDIEVLYHHDPRGGVPVRRRHV
jgi:hypothetical protein